MKRVPLFQYYEKSPESLKTLLYSEKMKLNKMMKYTKEREEKIGM